LIKFRRCSSINVFHLIINVNKALAYQTCILSSAVPGSRIMQVNSTRERQRFTISARQRECSSNPDDHKSIICTRLYLKYPKDALHIFRLSIQKHESFQKVKSAI